MPADLDRRTYDLMRLVRTHEPIGSIRLVDLLQQRGYDIKGRTVRLMLSDLDEAGFTQKVPGKGRRLTSAGHAELDRGDVEGRLRQVRERIATRTSQVTYDPTVEAGELLACTAAIASDDVPAAFDALESLGASSLGPVVAAADVTDRGVVLRFPSSITLDGVFLSHGIDATLVTAGLVEYRPSDERVVRYIDTLSGEGSTIDVVRLLIEAGRTDVDATLAGETGVLVVDNREFPLTRFTEGDDLATATAANLGGVLDIRRPREDGPFPRGEPSWEFASLTYGGAGELALALLMERSLVDSWETLGGPVAREEFAPVSVIRTALAEADVGTER
ncbi:NrpR regulatory domain-containing protein [Salinigranum marinum]|uniref:NrpR regulatory domain-containing protein n=1 Tax=Salinigranum marinum TaxID=1515595 RepID=UPI002989AEB7|nr:NrpR regulatory domain-containing protein [Salinigranum marinum]